LFTGVLVKRIYGQTDEAAVRFPNIEFVKAPYLRDHPLVIDAFAERVAELQGEATPNMNCQLCKYRTQIVGYENEVGMAQQAHHHHVRGGDHHHDGHEHHHHDHDHSHPHEHR
jgi:sirohydrochlorin cobaltochelatase